MTSVSLDMALSSPYQVENRIDDCAGRLRTGGDRADGSLAGDPLTEANLSAPLSPSTQLATSYYGGSLRGGVDRPLEIKATAARESLAQ